VNKRQAKPKVLNNARVRRAVTISSTIRRPEPLNQALTLQICNKQAGSEQGRESDVHIARQPDRRVISVPAVYGRPRVNISFSLLLALGATLRKRLHAPCRCKPLKSFPPGTRSAELEQTLPIALAISMPHYPVKTNLTGSMAGDPRR